ncbi:MAG: hypothetical protein E7483_06220 [Ruminococcaceae bacterium]|nr:hypothetical protein [Oscillospiraceae bacterium]
MKKYFAVLLGFIIIFSLPLTAFADIGPKPSVRITFNGINDSTIYQNGTVYYGTLLSEHKSTGPSSAWDGVAGHEEYDGFDKEIWHKFADYTDKDGYYFLQEIWDCTETHQLNWTYYPPSKFKILLYFPETDIYFMSDIYERYAFDSYYTVDIIGDMYAGQMLKAEQSYDFTWEIISLLARIAATILIEILIAVVFFYREKRTLKFIAIVNIITQIALNVGLNIINYNKGSMAFTFYFILFEIAVFAAEAVIYSVTLKKLSSKPAKPGKPAAYAFAANLASFAIGLWISHIVPGIF